MKPHPIRLCGQEFLLDPAGALVWPKRSALVVADLHLGEADALARRGLLAPPYELEETLARLEALVVRYRPEIVVSLGDGLHDADAARALESERFDRLGALVRRQRWLWITGNHDPVVPIGLGGAVLPRFVCDGLTFAHVPSGAAAEVAGHLHPVARVLTPAGRVQRRRCFVGDGERLLLPALGTFAGGLDVLDPAIAGLFPGAFTAYLLGARRIFAVSSRGLVRDPDPRRHRLQAGRSSPRSLA
ncbi:MAG: ligase-associated DNA damage response endonuclease PdeM [Geminicoccaceae bacterium]|nr:ligase-associated DNA damage response endonuclease PdeM [Geminicoccaceae bacterium]MDW8342069.1 ligase-associated DNA damage response endonuclease PdeM [Geminicoccaceae bacterium]